MNELTEYPSLGELGLRDYFDSKKKSIEQKDENEEVKEIEIINLEFYIYFTHLNYKALTEIWPIEEVIRENGVGFEINKSSIRFSLVKKVSDLFSNLENYEYEKIPVDRMNYENPEIKLDLAKIVEGYIVLTDKGKETYRSYKNLQEV